MSHSCAAVGFAIELAGLLILFSFVQGHSQTEECGTHQLIFSLENIFKEEQEEKLVFGDSVRNLSPTKLKDVFRKFLRIGGKRERSLADDDDAFGYYQLNGLPFVFHVLPHHDNGAAGDPSLTSSQAEFAVKTTNHLFDIYDRETGTSQSFATFEFDQIVTHDDVEFDEKRDCGEISQSLLSELIMTTEEWEFKFHVIVCESSAFSGRAWFPQQYAPDSPMHNAMLMDYRSFACYDDQHNFLCESSDTGSNKSHTRWWRTRSAMIAHETAHLFGLLHTFSTDCWITPLLGGDRVSDTPVHTTAISKSCPGLLPYNRDRDLSDWRNTGPNLVSNATEQCELACGESCGACCDAEGDGVCPKYENDFDIISEEFLTFPQCCSDSRPTDSCPWSPGVDPLNNVMSYIPDECAHEFTVGQMARMMIQIKAYKTIVYCNYATESSAVCLGVPCYSQSTSPNCT